MPDMKYIAGGLAALGVLGAAAFNYVQIETPAAAQCQVNLADARARLELYAEVKDTCKIALTRCVEGGTP